MNEPLTEELLDELLESPSASAFVDERRRELDSPTLSSYLSQLLEEKGLKRASVIRAAGLNETFGYQIFTGQRNPSRNKVLQIAFAMSLTLKETSRLLQAAGTNDLYCKRRRDAIITFCLDKNHTLYEANEELYRLGEETIC